MHKKHDKKEYLNIEFQRPTTILEYQPSGEVGTRSPPATPHRLQYPKWPLGGPKMAGGV